jgi:hypothetical protein
MNKTDRTLVCREVVGFQMCANMAARQKPSWAVYSHGKREFLAALPTHRDAMLYAQTITRRRIAKKWAAQ